MLNVIMKLSLLMLLYTVPLAALVMTMFTLGNIGLAMAQGGTISMRFSTLNIGGSGPVTQVVCEPQLPSGSTDIMFRWIFEDKILAENNEVIAADSSRYGAFTNELNTFDYRLFIYNAVKEDEGVYQCQIEYHWNGNTHTLMEENQVDITYYLPPLNYPECSIEPSTTLTSGIEATFKCIAGESFPSVKLNLTLERQDGSTAQLSNATVEKMVISADNNTTFVCQMTSDTFLHVYRTCSAGPLIVLNKTMPTTKSSPSTIPTTLSVTSTHSPGSNSTPSVSSREHGCHCYTWGIVGGIIGAFLTAVTFVIIHVFWTRKSQPSEENLSTKTSSDHQSPSANQTYMSYQGGSEDQAYAALNQNKSLYSNDVVFNQQQKDAHEYVYSVPVDTSGV